MTGSFKRRIWEAGNIARGWEAVNSLPCWLDSWRPMQIRALEEIKEGFERGAQVVVVDAPPGSGKTVLGEAARLLSGGERNLYVCHSKALQDQFLGDFAYARVVKGRANYPTEIFVDSFPEISAADCTKHDGGGCEFCEATETCPYEIAKREAYKADVAVLNTSYFLSEANYVGGFGSRDFVVLDECDLLEKELMGFVEARVPKSYVERYKLGEPRFKTKEESWKEWLDERVLPILKTVHRRLKREAVDAKDRQRVRRMADHLQRLEGVSAKLGVDRGWVADVGGSGWVFKPVEVSQYGGSLIWQHSKRFLLMSGSVVSTSSLLNSLGFSGATSGVNVTSSFDKSSRKVRVLPTGSLSRKSSEEERALVFKKLSAIVEDTPGERILVHTVSHRLAEEARQAVETALRGSGGSGGRELFHVSDGADRERVVDSWLGSREGVFLSPSMDRGVDLKGDRCRVQVVLKVPFPNIGDKQVEARVYRTKGGRLWYAVETARSLIQATGRVTRSEEDWGVTYILDSEFMRFWRQWKGLFPGWWQEAVQFR